MVVSRVCICFQTPVVQQVGLHVYLGLKLHSLCSLPSTRPCMVLSLVSEQVGNEQQTAMPFTELLQSDMDSQWQPPSQHQ